MPAGCNDSGQLAAAPCTAQPTPQLVQGLPAGCPILFVAAGGDHSLVVLDRSAGVSDGSMQAVGACTLLSMGVNCVKLPDFSCLAPPLRCRSYLAHLCTPTPAGPCATRPHGAQWCPVELPDLLELTAQAAADTDDRARLEAVTAAVESIFSSPGYLLAAFSVQQQHPAAETQQQQPQQQQPVLSSGAAAQAGAGGVQPMDASPVEQPPAANGAAGADLQHAGQQGAAEAAIGGTQQQQEGRQQQPQAGGLDLQRIGATFQALLKLYNPAVVAAVGNTSVHLLDSERGDTAAARWSCCADSVSQLEACCGVDAAC